MCEQVASSWPTRQFDEAGVQRKLASPKVADRGSAATEIEKTLKAAKASVYKDWWLRETLGELKPTQPEVLGALGVPYYFLLAVIAGFGRFIPYLGAFIGWVASR